MASTGMVLNVVMASSAIDGTFEELDIEGMDVSSLDGPDGVPVNYEHAKDSAGPSQIVGRVTTIHKIYNKDDCRTDFEREQWDKLKLPYMAGTVRLFDGAGHPEAIALAAIIRDCVANKESVIPRWSVEGVTLHRVKNRLVASILRKLSCTIKPANKTAETEIIEDPGAPKGFQKTFETVEKADHEAPGCERLSPGHFGFAIEEDPLAKTLTAGSYNAAPGTLTGGAALMREDRTLKERAVDAIKKYGKDKFDKAEFKAFLKHELPDVSDNYLDHFSNVAEDFHMRRSQLRKAEDHEPRTALDHTTHGEHVKPNPHVKRPVLDEKEGVLHTPEGSFALHVPGADFEQILNHPKVEELFGKAMSGWVKAHKLHKEGRLPPELVAHAEHMGGPDNESARHVRGLLGDGSALVPDKHLVRHLTGLDHSKDAHTVDAVHKHLSDPANEDTAKALDAWYAKNHPAAKHVAEHPNWKEHFDRPEDAVHTAGWKHWLAIPPDERARGLSPAPSGAHGPFWGVLDPFGDGLQKAEDDLPAHTAKIHKQYVQDYGAVPAAMLFHAHLLPKLLDAAESRAKGSQGVCELAKNLRLDALDLELRKALSDYDSHPALMGAKSKDSVHKVSLTKDGKDYAAGRYLIKDGNLHHLEDYYGLLGQNLPEGPVTEATISRLHGLKSSPHLKVEEDHPREEESPRKEQSEQDNHSTLTAQKQPPTRPSVWQYQRAGHDSPHTLEVKNGEHYLDSNKLTYQETATILENLKNGAAKLRYPAAGAALRIQKAEEMLYNLFKAQEMDPEAALAHVSSAVKAGHVHPDVEAALRRHVFEDPMVPGLGNKFSYQTFREKNRPGVYVSMDGNDFRNINNTYGHDAGDSAIKAMGGAVRDAAAKTGGVKAWRSGGDEFFLHAPSQEHAAQFMRHAREHLDQLPPVNGEHKISMSFGLGHNFENADKALYKAKEQKLNPATGQRSHPVGQMPHLGHSLVPGHEGPIKMHHDETAVHAAAAPNPAPAALKRVA